MFRIVAPERHEIKTRKASLRRRHGLRSEERPGANAEIASATTYIPANCRRALLAEIVILNLAQSARLDEQIKTVKLSSTDVRRVNDG